MLRLLEKLVLFPVVHPTLITEGIISALVSILQLGKGDEMVISCSARILNTVLHSQQELSCSASICEAAAKDLVLLVDNCREAAATVTRGAAATVKPCPPFVDEKGELKLDVVTMLTAPNLFKNEYPPSHDALEALLILLLRGLGCRATINALSTLVTDRLLLPFKHILDDPSYYGATLWYLVVQCVVVICKLHDDTVVRAIYDNGLPTVILNTLAVAIPPSSDVLSYVPEILSELWLKRSERLSSISEPLHGLYPVFLSKRVFSSLLLYSIFSFSSRTKR